MPRIVRATDQQVYVPFFYRVQVDEEYGVPIVEETEFRLQTEYLPPRHDEEEPAVRILNVFDLSGYFASPADVRKVTEQAMQSEEFYEDALRAHGYERAGNRWVPV